VTEQVAVPVGALIDSAARFVNNPWIFEIAGQIAVERGERARSARDCEGQNVNVVRSNGLGRL
jgi:hypothetical protein